jgi:hypothetical protein
MKSIITAIIVLSLYLVFSCKEEETERFRLLTGPTWLTDSLIANGVNAGGPGGLLSKFAGEAKFKEDGTGTFGKYKGNWSFRKAETQLHITSDSLDIPVTADIIELNSASLKLKTLLPDPQDPFSNTINIRMTFKAK